MDPQAQNGTPQPPPPPPGFVPMNQDTSQAGNAPPPPPGFVPINASGSGAQPAQTAQPANPANPNNEGLYAMHSPDGRAVQIPYSKVHTSIQNGYLFGDKGTLQKYARDHAADPLSEGRVEQYLDQHPWVAAPVNALVGVGTGVDKTVTGLDRTPRTRFETELQLAAAKPTKGAVQGVGEASENVAEYFTGEELLSLLGKGAEGLALAEKLKNMTGLAQMLGKYPMLAKVLKIGSTVVKQGTIAGAQTYAKTGGDAGAAATAAGETGLLSGGLSTLGAGGAAIKTARAGTAEADAAAAAARVQTATESAAAANRATEEARAADSATYSDVARGAAKPHMEAINAARGNAQPMLASGAKVIDVDHILNTTHDFTGAADRLTEVNDEAYDALDKATDGRFRDLNKEVAKAQKAAWKGGNDEKGAYIEKLNEMEDLLNGHMGEAGMEELPAVKASWTQSYILRDIGNTLDRNLRGLPGASEVSNAQRGINGKGLHNDLLRLVKDYTRPKLEQVLGPGRLDTLEQIAERNMTDKQRQVFNGGVRTVAQELERMEQAAPTAKPPAQRMIGLGKRAGAVAIGGLAAHAAGMTPYWGMAAGEAGYEATHAVMNAIKANPKIAQNFMFALESGATAKRYGPFIAEMIQKNQTDASREQQAEEAPKEEGGSEQ